MPCRVADLCETSAACYLSILQDLGLGDEKERQVLVTEAGEIAAIFASSYNTASGRRRYSVKAGRVVDGTFAR